MIETEKVPAKVLFESLTPEDQTRIVAEVNEEVRKMNLTMAQEINMLRGEFYNLKPIIPSNHKGRIKCMVCQTEGKKKEFRHAARCVWFQLHSIG